MIRLLRRSMTAASACSGDVTSLPPPLPLLPMGESEPVTTFIDPSLIFSSAHLVLSMSRRSWYISRSASRYMGVPSKTAKSLAMLTL